LFFIFLLVVCVPALAWSQDETPPAAITNLSASPGINGGDIDLSWTAPGNNGWDGMISSGTYRIKYSTYSAYSWNHMDYDIAISTSNVSPGENQYQTVTGLDEGTTYYFRMWTADEADNWSSLSNGATSWAQDIRPAVIINLSALPGEIDQKISLSWSAPGDDGTTGILTGEYRIDYATYTKTWNPTDYEISITTSNVNPGDGQYREVSDLTAGATYYFRIWTRDEIPDHWSEISNEATTWAPAIPPAAVTDLEAISGATEGSINLSWTAPTEDGAIGGKVSSYILKYATFSVNDGGDTTVWWNHPQTLTGLDEGSPKEPGETETLIIPGLSPGNTYYFAIKSIDDVEAISPIDTKTASFNQANAIPPGDDTPPAAITTLSAIPGTEGGAIDLSWKAPGDDGVTGTLDGKYRIDYATYTKSWNLTDYEISISTSGVNPGDAQSYTVTGLKEGATYYFRIWTADDLNNWSEISNGATTWAKDILPAAIINLSASPGEIDQKINLSWSAPGDDGDSGILTGEYIIDYATYTKTWNPTDYKISIPTSNINPGDDQYREVLNLTVGATYYFRIWTRDEVPNHWSDISNEATAWAPSIPPAAVTDLEAVSGTTEGSISLTWTAPREDGPTGGKVSSYILKYSTFSVNDVGDTTGWWNHPQTLTGLDGGSPKEPGETESFIIPGFSPGNTYYFAIKSRDDLGSISPIDTKTASFNQANAVAATDDIPPAAITDLVAEPGGYERIDLSWTAPGDDGWQGKATEYTIKYATYVINAANFEAVLDVKERSVTVSGGSSDSETIIGLMAYTTYYFAIKTEDKVGNVSGISNIASAATGTDSLPPKEPVGIRGILSADGETMTISWRAVTENVDGTPCTDLKGYNVYRAPIVDGDYVERDFVARGESLVWTDPENIKGQIFYYMVRAKDTSGNLSRSSMIVDSSVDMNIIAVSGEDGSTRIAIPREIGQILYKETNSYGEDVIMEVLRDKEEDERVIKSFNFIARGEQSGKEIKDFVFAKPLARIALAYEVENGYVKQASSVPEKLASEQLALFWFNGLEWIKLGGEVDEYFHLVSVMSKRIGKYMIRISFRGSSFGIESIQPDKIFTPNGDGWNDYIEIHYANPKDAFVNGKIYDVRGALIAEMEKRAGEETLIWDGKDTNGDTVVGGVYIYEIQVVGAENKVINGTVVVAR
jgi:gliding motility-associated-like protein